MNTKINYTLYTIYYQKVYGDQVRHENRRNTLYGIARKIAQWQSSAWARNCEDSVMTGFRCEYGLLTLILAKHQNKLPIRWGIDIVWFVYAIYAKAKLVKKQVSEPTTSSRE